MMPLLPLDSHPPGATDLPPPVDDAAEDDVGRRRRRRWSDKFKCAFRGLKLGVRGHSSFSAHFFFTALVLAAGAILIRSAWEWCALLGCIGFVLTTELVNSALETLVRGLDAETRERVWPCLDVAAGAVLLASITAALIGSIIFLRHLVVLLWP